MTADKLVEERRRAAPLPPSAPTICIGIDGVPMRKPETAGGAGEQPEGSAKTREA